MKRLANFALGVANPRRPSAGSQPSATPGEGSLVLRGYSASVTSSAGTLNGAFKVSREF